MGGSTRKLANRTWERVSRDGFEQKDQMRFLAKTKKNKANVMGLLAEIPEFEQRISNLEQDDSRPRGQVQD